MHVQQGRPQPGPGPGPELGLGPEIWIRGPVALPEEPPPSPGAFRPRRYSWVGVCGGAGVSTLASVYGGHDSGREWPGPADPPSVLLVARTHAAGLTAALNALEVFRRGEAPHGLDLDAVVLVADAPGRLPRPLADRVKVIESVIDVYRVPWVPSWRLGDLNGQPPRETEALARLTGRSR
ncbi:DUF6668 family protein [Streptomyces coerulescens]|uniref:DUF6668 family protein n=1 Tax=Streptomyces coerulescens TaxID=29304 RepID=A0ABW0CKK6_STRCD